jgi:hypothetical protein
VGSNPTLVTFSFARLYHYLEVEEKVVEWEENRGFEILDVGFVWTLFFFHALAGGEAWALKLMYKGLALCASFLCLLV